MGLDDLTRDEVYLLDWLAKADGGSPFDSPSADRTRDWAEAISAAVDGLVEKGLATVSGGVVWVTAEGFKVASGA